MAAVAARNGAVRRRIESTAGPPGSFASCPDCSGLSHPRLSGETPSVRPGTSADRGPQHRNGEQRAGPLVAAQADSPALGSIDKPGQRQPVRRVGGDRCPASHQSAARKASRGGDQGGRGRRPDRRAAPAYAGMLLAAGHRWATARSPDTHPSPAGPTRSPIVGRPWRIASRVAAQGHHPGRVVPGRWPVTAEASFLVSSPTSVATGTAEVGVGQCEQAAGRHRRRPRRRPAWTPASTAAIASSRLPPAATSPARP